MIRFSKLAGRTALTLFMLGLIVTFGMGQAKAEDVPTQSVYFGGYVGGNLVLDDWKLRKEGRFRSSDTDHQPKSSAQFGLRAGAQIFYWLGVEGQLGFLPYKSTDGDNPDTGDTNCAMNWSADLLLHPHASNWVPFFDIGLGAYHNIAGDLGLDSDPEFHYGLGWRGMLTDLVAFRVDVRHVISEGVKDNSNVAQNLQALAGLDFFLWSWGEKKEEGPKDTDGDGIPDKDDRCPTKPGPATFRGCPDSDGDGIPDVDDKCPQTPGIKELQGCPDRDGDGITDADDRCPDDPGPIEYQGCPDKDGDGIPDVDDKCPEVKGLPEKQGCLPEMVKKFSGTIAGITFQTGSAKILKKSYELLNEAAEILSEYKSLKIKVEGHTDSQGKEDYNQKLSEKRAKAVVDYLVKKGAPADQLSSEGFGESKPIADNNTKEGRAKNRRIEFIIHD